MEKETFELFMAQFFAIGMWTGIAWWIVKGLFPTERHWHGNTPRYYIAFPELCTLTPLGNCVKWIIIYPFIVVLNIVYITTTIPAPISVALMYGTIILWKACVELLKVYKGFFKYCMCKNFKASDIHCYKW